MLSYLTCLIPIIFLFCMMQVQNGAGLETFLKVTMTSVLRTKLTPVAESMITVPIPLRNSEQNMDWRTTQHSQSESFMLFPRLRQEYWWRYCLWQLISYTSGTFSCRNKGPGRMLSVKVFLRDSSPCLCNIQRKTQKLRDY